MSELKPCPFCGGEARYCETDRGLVGGTVYIEFQIRCKKCDATAPGAGGNLRLSLTSSGKLFVCNDARLNAAEAWNRRGD